MLQSKELLNKYHNYYFCILTIHNKKVMIVYGKLEIQ